MYSLFIFLLKTFLRYLCHTSVVYCVANVAAAAAAAAAMQILSIVPPFRYLYNFLRSNERHFKVGFLLYL